MTAYISLVRSTLEYGATIWDPYLEKDISKIEKIQRKAIRFICNDYRSKTPGSVTNMQSELKLPDLKVRRKEKRLCFLYSIQKGTVPAINKNDYLIPLQNKKVNTPQTNTANEKCADTKTPHVRNSITSLNINFRSFWTNRDTFFEFISIAFPTPRYHFWYRNLAH